MGKSNIKKHISKIKKHKKSKNKTNPKISFLPHTYVRHCPQCISKLSTIKRERKAAKGIEKDTKNFPGIYIESLMRTSKRNEGCSIAKGIWKAKICAAAT